MIDEANRIAKKRASNRAGYAASKPRQDHVLLRLPKGAAGPLDDVSAAAGLSRSAFAGIYLTPLLAALAPALPAIDAACRRRGQSLSQFMAAAIASALAQADEDPEAQPAASEFDELFAPGSL